MMKTTTNAQQDELADLIVTKIVPQIVHLLGGAEAAGARRDQQVLPNDPGHDLKVPLNSNLGPDQKEETATKQTELNRCDLNVPLNSDLGPDQKDETSAKQAELNRFDFNVPLSSTLDLDQKGETTSKQAELNCCDFNVPLSSTLDLDQKGETTSKQAELNCCDFNVPLSSTLDLDQIDETSSKQAELNCCDLNVPLNSTLDPDQNDETSTKACSHSIALSAVGVDNTSQPVSPCVKSTVDPAGRKQVHINRLMASNPWDPGNPVYLIAMDAAVAEGMCREDMLEELEKRMWPDEKDEEAKKNNKKRNKNNADSGGY